MSRRISRWARAGCCLVVPLMLCLALAPTARAAQPSAAAAGAGRTSHPLPEQASSSTYIIGPGDVLEVFVWQNSQLSVTVPVRPDGQISTPLVQNMVAAGKTPAELAKDMERKLSKYLRNPTVNIIVTQPVGALSEVKAVGQVTHPEAIPYHAGMRVLDVVLAAGGLTEYAAGNRARIVRTIDGKTHHIPVKLGRLMNSGDMSQNLLVRPGDVLVVPQTFF